MYSGITLSALDTCIMDIRLNHPLGFDRVSKMSLEDIKTDPTFIEWGLENSPMATVLLKHKLKERK